MRNFVAAIMAASLLATPVFAGGLPLPAGKPAGITAAQYNDHTILYIVGGAVIIAGIVILATNNGSKVVPATTPVSASTTTTT
jgi:hypothetical protein